mgnify:CR=1 FL=1
MSFSRPIQLNNTLLGAGKEPLACTPLVGADEAAVLRELAVILPKRPDLLEWRVDFFAAIADTGRVVALAQAIRQQAGDIPLHQQAGNQRRVRRSYVLAWHRQEQARRRKAISQLGADLDSEIFAG